MPKGNSQKGTGKPRKYSYNHPKKYIQKQQAPKWQCGICHSMNQPEYPYCFNCWMEFQYYTFVNQHMFVKSDDSYLDIYYPQASKKDLETCSISTYQSENDSQNQGQLEEKQLQINWVEDLLQDE